MFRLDPVQRVINYTRFAVHGFGSTRLRKIMNIRKLFDLLRENQLCMICVLSKNCVFYDAEISFTRISRTLKRNFLFTRFSIYTCFQERNPTCNWGLSVHIFLSRVPRGSPWKHFTVLIVSDTVSRTVWILTYNCGFKTSWVWSMLFSIVTWVGHLCDSDNFNSGSWFFSRGNFCPLYVN